MHLTYPDPDPHTRTASTTTTVMVAKEAGAPESEIKVTPGMIEAGVAALRAYNCDFETPWSAAERIYRAMRTKEGWASGDEA